MLEQGLAASETNIKVLIDKCFSLHYVCEVESLFVGIVRLAQQKQLDDISLKERVT